MERKIEVWQVRALFDRVQLGSGDVSSNHVMMNLPQYLPPVLLAHGTEEKIEKALMRLRQIADSAGCFAVSARYEDHRRPDDSCVVLSLEWRAVERNVNIEWARTQAEIVQELLASGIGVAIHAGDTALGVDFRMPVQRWDCKSVVHRDSILLVEDDAFVRESSCEVLEAGGYRVFAARDAEEALTVFDQHRKSICAIVADVTLPGMNGKELARALHAVEPSIPILLTSGYNAPVPQDRSRRCFYLAKPYHAAGLLEGISRSLESYHRTVPSIPIPAVVERSSSSAKSGMPFARRLDAVTVGQQSTALLE